MTRKASTVVSTTTMGSIGYLLNLKTKLSEDTPLTSNTTPGNINQGSPSWWTAYHSTGIEHPGPKATCSVRANAQATSVFVCKYARMYY
ncbi:hypothetical protein HNY73_011940 [Argiope bruennichi]|uniref:Uncharacterized protein n=1 Tax=Argiope bruennichi TaxID=94029 RepID=A0A8T0ETD1_ARGBR|nr:hypothetical protein HNY73_011940 [Argiope bruennichi]